MGVLGDILGDVWGCFGGIFVVFGEVLGGKHRGKPEEKKRINNIILKSLIGNIFNTLRAYSPFKG